MNCDVFYVSVPNSELHGKICQSRTISTVEIFRTAFLCRLPVRTAYKHIQAHMQGANVQTHTGLRIYNHQSKLSHEHDCRNTDLFFRSHLSDFCFLLACQHKICFVSAHKELYYNRPTTLHFMMPSHTFFFFLPYRQ